MTATTCPFCQRNNPLAEDVDRKGITPEDGDLSFCFGCGEWAIFDSDWGGGCRKPTHDEYEEIVSHEVAQKMRAAWLVTMKRATR